MLGPRTLGKDARTLTAPRNLDGLIAWTRRPEWREPLARCLDRHTAKACDAAGIDPAEIEDLLGAYAATTIWGAAFEDLLATDLPDGRNLADEYLRRRGWKESAATREYIAGLRHSAISLYEVSGLVPGESMLLRDLVRGGAPIRVMEKSGSRGLRQWDRIATRVITLRETAVISGTLMVFDQATSEALLASLRRIGKRAPREVAEAAREAGIATDAEVLAELLTPDLLLAGAAFMVTGFWLDAALKAAQGRDRPTVVNSDGEPLEFTTLHFPLLPGATAAQIRAALGRVAALRAENDHFWNWLAEPGTRPERRGSMLACVVGLGPVVLGGFARLLTLRWAAPLGAETGFALAVELAVAPALLLWQRHYVRRRDMADPRRSDLRCEWSGRIVD
jgi:hypothetical protein